MKGNEAHLRKSALSLLGSLLTNRALDLHCICSQHSRFVCLALQGRFRGSIERSCSELMRTYLSGQEPHKQQGNIIEILYGLTADLADPTPLVQVGGVGEAGSRQEMVDQYASLNGIISPHISLLLKIALLTDQRAYPGDLLKHAEGILLENLTRYPGSCECPEGEMSA